MHKKENRRHFHAKTTSAKLNIYIEVGSRDLFIDEAHTALDIFPACCLIRFAAFPDYMAHICSLFGFEVLPISA